MDPYEAFDNSHQTSVLQDQQQRYQQNEGGESQPLGDPLAPLLGEARQPSPVQHGAEPNSEQPYLPPPPLMSASAPVEESSLYEPIPLEHAGVSAGNLGHGRGLPPLHHLLYPQLMNLPYLAMSAPGFGAENPSVLGAHAPHQPQHQLPPSSPVNSMPPPPLPPNLLRPTSAASDPAPPTAGDRGGGAGDGKEGFVLFVKVLLRCVGRSGDPPGRLRDAARATILECTRRNREGDAAYAPLLQVLVRRLRDEVGEPHWSRAALLCHRYLERRRASSAAVAV